MWDKHVRYHPDQTKWPTKRTFEVSPSCEVMRRKVVLHSSQYDDNDGINDNVHSDDINDNDDNDEGL